MARTLVTTAVIRGSDQLSPMLSRMSAQVGAFNKQMQSGMAAMSRGTMLGGGSIAAAFGMGGLLRSTREYYDLLFDAKAALAAGDVDDPFSSSKISVVELTAQVTKLHEKSLALSKELGLVPEFFAKAANAAARAGTGEDTQAYMRAAGLGKLADRELDASRAVMDLVTLDILYGNAKARGDDAERLQQERMAKVAAVAALTKTSPSGVFEGMRNVAGISALFGNDLDANLALIGTMVQGGALDKEAGTAIKSLITRLLNPTRMGVSALGRSQIDRANFMDFSGIDPKRATDQMAQLFAGRYNVKRKGALLQHLEAAKKSGAMNSVDFAGDLYEWMVKNKVIRADPNTQEDDIAKVAGAAQRAGGRLDIFEAAGEFAKAMADGRLDPGDLGLIGEMRRIHQTGILIKNFELAKKLRDRLKEEKGAYLDLIAGMRKEDYAGKLAQIEASWERLKVNLVKSPGIQTFVGQMADLAGALERADPRIVSMAGWGLVAAVAAGPLMALGRGLAYIVTAGAGAARWIGAVAAAPFTRIATGSAGAVAGLAMLGSRFATIAFIGARVAGVLAPIARFTGIIGAGMLALSAVQNWESILSFFQQLGSIPGVQALGESVTRLRDALAPIGEAAGRAYDGLLKMFGIESTGDLLKGALDGIASILATIFNKAADAIKKITELFQMQNQGGHFGGGNAEKGGPSTMEGIIPQRFERSRPLDGEGLREASNRPLMLDGDLRVAVDVRAQGAQAGAEVTGMLRGPANAMPVRKMNGSAMGA